MSTELFNSLIDSLVLTADRDPELKAGLEWIDEESKKNGVDFYEQAYRVITKYCAEKQAKTWLHNREQEVNSTKREG